MKKKSMLVSNTSSFNGCHRLTYFIVTKLTIDSVHHHHDDENPSGSTPLHLPYGYWSEIRSRVRIWRARQHTPTTNSQEYPPPRITKLMIDSVHFLAQKSRVTPLYLPYRYWSEIASRIRIGRVGRHTPTTYFINWPSLRPAQLIMNEY